MTKNTVQQIPLRDLIRNRYQPRKIFKDSDIAELALSIQAVGLLHPPLVRQVPSSHLFEIISGERRVLACKKLGFETIDVIVRDNAQDDFTAKAALIENVQRVDLDPIETAKAIKRLLDEFGATQEEIAQKIGKKRSTVSNFLRLLQLPDHMQQAVSSGDISFAHAKVVLSCPKESQQALFLQVVQQKLSVRQSENLCQELVCRQIERKKTKKMNKTTDMYCKDLERRLEAFFGVKAEVQAKKEKGKVTLYFYNFDDLDRIMELCDS